MKFLVDANLPPGLAAWLREHSHDAIHVKDQPGLAVDDRAIFEFARGHGYIIMTKDEDFAALATLSDFSKPGTDRRIRRQTSPTFPRHSTDAPDRARRSSLYLASSSNPHIEGAVKGVGGAVKGVGSLFYSQIGIRPHFPARGGPRASRSPSDNRPLSPARKDSRHLFLCATPFSLRHLFLCLCLKLPV